MARVKFVNFSNCKGFKKKLERLGYFIAIAVLTTNHSLTNKIEHNEKITRSIGNWGICGMQWQRKLNNNRFYQGYDGHN
jgi:hypothetical protein